MGISIPKCGLKSKLGQRGAAFLHGGGPAALCAPRGNGHSAGHVEAEAAIREALGDASLPLCPRLRFEGRARPGGHDLLRAQKVPRGPHVATESHPAGQVDRWMVHIDAWTGVCGGPVGGVL